MKTQRKEWQSAIDINCICRLDEKIADTKICEFIVLEDKWGVDTQSFLYKIELRYVHGKYFI